MLICDKCKQPITTPRNIYCQTKLPVEFNCNAWQHKELDLCQDCVKALNAILTQTKCDFINERKEEQE